MANWLMKKILKCLKIDAIKEKCARASLVSGLAISCDQAKKLNSSSTDKISCYCGKLQLNCQCNVVSH